MKKTLDSLKRITLLLAILLGMPALIYWIWTPGADFSNSKLDKRKNAIWLGHGWLGDDVWFRRNQRNIEDFRSKTKIHELLQKLQSNHIKYVYPHLCPAKYNGEIAAYDSEQLERFLAIAAEFDILVIPWIGGVLDDSARPEEDVWRKNFVASVAELIAKHPKIAGVQINIEPMPCGNLDFLTLLEELRPALAGRILSVAAYPPPTLFHQFPDVHWELPYLAEVAKRSDQMAVMMYDTSIKFNKFYINLMRQWAGELQDAVAFTECKLLLGVPAYDDAGVGYHDPTVENLANALRGIQSATVGKNYQGIAIYCEWEMTPEKWKIWQKFLAK